MLPKNRRLSRPDFLKAKSRGQNYRFLHFNIVVLPNSLGVFRFSIVTSSKFHKRAVVRNHFRRQLYFFLKSQSGSADLIFFPKPSMLKLSHEEIYSLLSQALSQLPPA